jgi:dihydropteroate synthase
MTNAEFYETHLQKLRNDLIQSIIDFVKRQKANELSLDRCVVVREIDDQFSESIQTIKADGDVTIAIPLDEGYESDLTEFHNDILLQILRELEEGRFEVFEEDGGEE